jgi:HEAT repeat protein
MKAILLVVSALGAGAAGTAAVVWTAPHAATFSAAEPWDDRPGPDSARVGLLLAAMEAADPVACELIGDNLGNGWWNGDAWGVGRLSDARPGARAARDSLSGRVRDPGAIRRLAATLGHENPCVRRVAAAMLGRSAADDATLHPLLDDPSPRIREAALMGAGHGERMALREKGEAMLRDREEPVATMAAWMLGELEDAASVGPLTGSLERGGRQLRIASAWALGEIEHERAVPALRQALRDPDATLRAAAADALGSIESPDGAEDLERLVTSDPDRHVRLEAIEALGDIEVARSAPALGSVLDGNDVGLSIAAAEALANLDDLEQAPAGLVRAAASPDARLRHAAAHALGEIADPATVQALTRLLGDADPEIRRAAVQGLGEIGSRDAVPALTRALDDPDPEIRRAVAEALGEIEEE